jgi:hypothetical protein
MLVEILEQLLARQILAGGHDPRQAPVSDADLVQTTPLPRHRTRRLEPATMACRLRSVVRPNDRLVRAYSSFPIRRFVTSSRSTTVASTLSLGRPGRLMSRAVRRRMAGSARPKVARRAYFDASWSARHCWWYRYCLRPRASRPTTCTWPRSSGQIHTSSQAGGIARARIRASVLGSRMAPPSAAR